eukprot:8051260-Alexandrium_andersonii.AAC.1
MARTLLRSSQRHGATAWPTSGPCTRSRGRWPMLTQPATWLAAPSCLSSLRCAQGSPASKCRWPLVFAI